MQPLFRLTGDPNVDWIVFVVGFFMCPYWLRAFGLAREGVRLFLRNLATAGLIFIVSQLLLAGAHIQGNSALLPL